MKIQLEQPLIITVKVMQGKHRGQIVPVSTTMGDLLDEDLSMQLINANVFESIGHPCDYYEILSVEYQEEEQ